MSDQVKEGKSRDVEILEEMVTELKVDLDCASEENARLQMVCERLKAENEHQLKRIHWLEGKIDAVEFCVKNGGK